MERRVHEQLADVAFRNGDASATKLQLRSIQESAFRSSVVVTAEATYFDNLTGHGGFRRLEIEEDRVFSSVES
jgi:hypothetical protein